MADHNCLVVRLDKHKTRELVLAPVYTIKGVHVGRKAITTVYLPAKPALTTAVCCIVYDRGWE